MVTTTSRNRGYSLCVQGDMPRNIPTTSSRAQVATAGIRDTASPVSRIAYWKLRKLLYFVCQPEIDRVGLADLRTAIPAMPGCRAAHTHTLGNQFRF